MNLTSYQRLKSNKGLGGIERRRREVGQSKTKYIRIAAVGHGLAPSGRCNTDIRFTVDIHNNRFFPFQSSLAPHHLLKIINLRDKRRVDRGWKRIRADTYYLSLLVILSCRWLNRAELFFYLISFEQHIFTFVNESLKSLMWMK